ncbi:glycyl-radical enzyme activating protein [Candidatus Poribacteria bacterium]|nr:glycyl-radical enzyme activating protein [Candidatus Poribacteria bacterium]
MSEQEKSNISEGVVLEIQRMSTEDGPGIRTTVFFKGCSLKCSWCHNPESISLHPQLHWIGSRCIGCKTCRDVCPNGALLFTESGVLIDRNMCKGCGTCAEACPSNALELLGKRWTLDSLTAEVVKDRAYFEKSGGGVTVSGGEPTVQAKFVEDFLMRLQKAGIHTALDTCGMCSRDVLDRILFHVDMVLFDIKEIDADKHRQFTGKPNEKILENLVRVSEHMLICSQPDHLWVRTPIIPGATAREDNIRGIGKFIASRLHDTVSRWDLCAFNNLCRDKYVRLGLDWPFKNAELLTKEFMEELAEIARDSVTKPEIVRWSGSTKLDEDKGESRHAMLETSL